MKKEIKLTTLLNEMIKQELNESKIDNLANVIKFIKTHKYKWADTYGIDHKLIDNLINSGITSRDIFTFSSLFPRKSFKISDITSGQLQQKIKSSIIDNSAIAKFIKMADALSAVLKAMDKKMGGNDWLRTY